MVTLDNVNMLTGIEGIRTRYESGEGACGEREEAPGTGATASEPPSEEDIFEKYADDVRVESIARHPPAGLPSTVT